MSEVAAQVSARRAGRWNTSLESARGIPARQVFASASSPRTRQLRQSRVTSTSGRKPQCPTSRQGEWPTIPRRQHRAAGVRLPDRVPAGHRPRRQAVHSRRPIFAIAGTARPEASGPPGWRNPQDCRVVPLPELHDLRPDQCQRPGRGGSGTKSGMPPDDHKPRRIVDHGHGVAIMT